MALGLCIVVYQKLSCHHLANLSFGCLVGESSLTYSLKLWVFYSSVMGDVLPLNVRLVCSELAWKFAERLLSLLQTLMVPGLNSRIGQGVCQEALLSNITHTLIFRVLRLDA